MSILSRFALLTTCVLLAACGGGGGGGGGSGGGGGNVRPDLPLPVPNAEMVRIFTNSAAPAETGAEQYRRGQTILPRADTLFATDAHVVTSSSAVPAFTIRSNCADGSCLLSATVNRQTFRETVVRRGHRSSRGSVSRLDEKRSHPRPVRRSQSAVLRRLDGPCGVRCPEQHLCRVRHHGERWLRHRRGGPDRGCSWRDLPELVWSDGRGHARFVRGGACPPGRRRPELGRLRPGRDFLVHSQPGPSACAYHTHRHLHRDDRQRPGNLRPGVQRRKPYSWGLLWPVPCRSGRHRGNRRPRRRLRGKEAVASANPRLRPAPGSHRRRRAICCPRSRS